jgi:hypothetical protein
MKEGLNSSAPYKGPEADREHWPRVFSSVAHFIIGSLILGEFIF